MGWGTEVGRDVPIPPKRLDNAMNVCASLRADGDIGPYQMPHPQLFHWGILPVGKQPDGAAVALVSAERARCPFPYEIRPYPDH